MQSQDCTEPVHNLEVVQFLLRTQVVVQVSIVNKSKEILPMSSCSSIVTINVEHVLKPPHKGLLEVRQLGETPFPSIWVRAQRDLRPVECPCSRHHHLRDHNPLPLVSSDALTMSVCYVCKLCSCIHETVQHIARS